MTTAADLAPMTLVSAILICEVAFWGFLVAGLIARYPLRRPRLGLALLLGSPAADLALLALTAVDLHRGAVATQVHALATLYLGFTVAFGRSIGDRADRGFAHRFAGDPPPAKPPRAGPLRVDHEWRQFRRAVLAWIISRALLVLLAVLIGDVQRAGVLLGYVAIVSVVLVIWFLTGPVPAIVSARRTSRAADLGRTASRPVDHTPLLACPSCADFGPPSRASRDT